MSMYLAFKPSQSQLTAAQIAALRRISACSIQALRQHAVDGTSVLEIPVFNGDWPAGRPTVLALLDGIEAGRLPLTVHDVRVCPDGAVEDEQLDIATARDRLDTLQSIAHEQAMHAQLERGAIASPEDYMATDDDV